MKTKKSHIGFTVLSALFVLGFIAQNLIFEAIQSVNLNGEVISVGTGALCGIGIFAVVIIAISQMIYMFIIVPFHFLAKHVLHNFKNPFAPMTEEDIEKLNRPVFTEYIND